MELGFGDGFRFGCGFALALFLASLILGIAGIALVLVLAILGLTAALPALPFPGGP